MRFADSQPLPWPFATWSILLAWIVRASACSSPAAGRDRFWCSRTRRAWAFRFASASVCGRPLLGRYATALVGPDRLNRLCFACDFALRAYDRPIIRPPLLRFGSLQRLQVVLRYPRRPAFGPSRFDVALADPDSAGGRTIWSTCRPCGFSALCPPCARPAPRDLCHGSHRPGPGHSPRSLFRAAFRYPLTEPFHDLAGSSLHSTRQRSWDFSRPSQFSLPAGPRISAVHPHLPLSDSFTRKSADFYGLPVAHFSTPSRVIVKKRPTARTIRPASGSCCRGQAEPLLVPHWNMPPTNPAMGFLRFSRACRMPFHSTRLSRARHRARASATNRRSRTFVGCHPLMGFKTTDTGSAIVLLARET
jgi:hypothetical protein